MFQVGLPSYLGLNSGMLVSINVQQNEDAFSQKHSWRMHVSPMFPSFPYGKHCFQCQFCFQDANYAYATCQGILTKMRACEHLQKFCEHEQASTHLFLRAIRAKAKFCEHFQIGWDHSIPLNRAALCCHVHTLYTLLWCVVCFLIAKIHYYSKSSNIRIEKS